MATNILQRLRAHAISQSLFPPTTLKAAIERLGFVQADPIRSPASAQDLILRHRVKDYHARDLERRYASLNIEEDVLYAYGFLPRETWRLLHPRDTTNLSQLEKKVLDKVLQFGPMHPRELQEHFGSDRIINAWGGYSKATTRVLENLHYRGLLRIARREKGIRVYEDASQFHESSKGKDRLHRLVLLVANILAPCPRKSLQETINRVRHSVPNASALRTVLDELLRTGALTRETVDEIEYVWPANSPIGEAPSRVRLLAPFDPVVWDRRRFEHLWGWSYRFEAYTPVAKRVRGYYAMPLLWNDRVIGWSNVTFAGGKLQVESGFVDKQPRDARFRAELALEIERMEAFLK